MVDVGKSVEEELHPENPLNNEEGNLRDGDIWVNLNGFKIINLNCKEL